MTEKKNISTTEASARRKKRYQERAKLAAKLGVKYADVPSNTNAHHTPSGNVVPRDKMADSKASGRGHKHGMNYPKK